MAVYNCTQSVDDQRDVFYLEHNEDRTEGRGPIWLGTPCSSIHTAKRLGKGKCVQGGDCKVVSGKAYLINGFWYYRSRHYMPNEEDQKKDQADRILEQKKKAYQKVLDKVQKLGITEEDLKILEEGY